MTKGIIIFYVNVNVEHFEVITPQTMIDMTKENHQENIKVLKDDGWEVMFIPCVGEASRVEKVTLPVEDIKSAV